MRRINKQPVVWLIGVISFVCLMCFWQFNIQIARVSGHSMLPAVKDRELVLIHKKKSPNRYDMVAFEQGDKQLIKRVIGVPGDSYVRNGNRLIIGDESAKYDFSFVITLSEEAASALPTSGFFQEGEYFVVGDALLNSRDSRVFGCIVKEDILGVVSKVFD